MQLARFDDLMDDFDGLKIINQSQNDFKIKITNIKWFEIIPNTAFADGVRNSYINNSSAISKNRYVWNIYDEIKRRKRSSKLIQRLVVELTTFPLRSCTSPILSRWQFLPTRCKWHTTSTKTRRTIDFDQWVANTEQVCICASLKN